MTAYRYTVKSFLEKFNHSPKSISEIAGHASLVSDDIELFEKAMAYMKAEDELIDYLNKIGFEFG